MKTDKQKILIVSTHPTHPVNAGNRAAIMSQVYILRQLGCEVFFLYAETSLKSNSYRSELVKYWGEHLLYYNEPTICKLYRRGIDKIRTNFQNSYWKCDDHYVSGLAAYVNKLNKTYNFDACIVQYSRLSKLLTKISIPRKAIFTHDVFSYKDIRVGERFYETVDAHQEAIAMQRCPNIFAIQDNEAIYYKFLSPLSRVYTVYNPYRIVKQPITKNNTLLFLAGGMDFNINGIKWFLDNIWPEIRQAFPDMQLKIGGAVCNKITKDYPNVQVMGYIDNLDEFYAMGDIVINPVYQGTGLKIKTFEALSYGKVVLTHPHSTNGIFEKKRAPIFASEITSEWVKFINSLREENNKIEMLQASAFEYIESMNDYISKQYNEFLSR